ncbi:MAG: sigma-70 family RNA polymerase sigma factor [Planctomycetes bacterium]|nr:sigma-70 family RNA polymerase sigma factor [Planctomycetota bacterium]
MASPRLPDSLQRHAGLIHKVAFTYCRNATDREEVVQEIAVQLWRAWDRYDPRFAESTWVYRVALNVAISWFRREHRHHRTRVELDPECLSAPEPAESTGDCERLLRCIDELDLLDRALVLLNLDGNDHATTAEVLGISTSNVGTRLSRIRQRLRMTLAPRLDNLNP